VTSRTGDRHQWLRRSLALRGDRAALRSACRGPSNLRPQPPDLRDSSRRAVLRALSLIPTDEDRFRDGGFTSLSLDFRAGCIGLCPKMIGRKGEQPKVIVVWPMAMGWTRPAIASLPEIVDRLLDILVQRGTVRELRNGRRKIVGRPNGAMFRQVHRDRRRAGQNSAFRPARPTIAKAARGFLRRR